MASFSVSAAGGGGRSQLYFCYQCNRTVSITPSPTSDLLCPDCNSGFLEEYENREPVPDPFFSLDPLFGGGSTGGGNFGLGFSSETGLLFNSSGHGSTTAAGLDDLSAVLGGGPAFNPNSNSDAFSPIAFLQNYIQTLRAGGANIQFVIENSPSGGGDAAISLPLNLNLGDYFVGPGLEQLIQHLAENDPNRYGTPPASKSAVEALPVIKISKELLASDSCQCAVCKDTFELGEEAKEIPCKHIYHLDCILPWLEMHNSCPVCRYELPTDDPDYEQNTQRTSAPRVSGDRGGNDGANNSSSVAEETPETHQSTERRFRISLPFPWLFGASSPPAEASNSGSGGNSNNSDSRDGDSSAGNTGGSDFSSRTRQQ